MTGDSLEETCWQHAMGGLKPESQSDRALRHCSAATPTPLVWPNSASLLPSSTCSRHTFTCSRIARPLHRTYCDHEPPAYPAAGLPGPAGRGQGPPRGATSPPGQRILRGDPTGQPTLPDTLAEALLSPPLPIPLAEALPPPGRRAALPSRCTLHRAAASPMPKNSGHSLVFLPYLRLSLHETAT